MRPDEGTGDRRPLIWTTVGTVLGLTLLYVSTRKVDPEALLATVRSAEPVPAIGILACTLTFAAIKTWRWSLLLPFIPDLKLSRLHKAVYIGLAVNFLVAHVGEFLKAATVARGSKATISSVVASVVLERALDFLALLLLLVLLTSLASELPGFVDMAVLITGAIVVLSVLGLYLLLHTPAWLTRMLAAAARPLSARVKAWLLQQLKQLRKGLATLRSFRMTAIAIGASVLQWGFVVLAIWCSARAVGVEAELVPVSATFVLIIVGLTLPNSPLQIGTTQLAFTVGLGAQGVAATDAVAASLVYTLLLIVPIMLIGGACLLRGRHSADVQPG